MPTNVKKIATLFKDDNSKVAELKEQISQTMMQHVAKVLSEAGRTLSSSSSFVCQEHIQHNVQEEQIAYTRCDKAKYSTNSRPRKKLK